MLSPMIGMGPQMTREMDPETKSQLGVLAYLKGIVEALQRRHVFHARIESKERSSEGEFMQITIANGIHYGGGMTIADNVDREDLARLADRFREWLDHERHSYLQRALADREAELLDRLEDLHDAGINDDAVKEAHTAGRRMVEILQQD